MKRVVFNQKGGVGKTSITCNLAAIGAAMGYRTLVVDLDVQGRAYLLFGALGDGIGVEPWVVEENGGTIAPLGDLQPFVGALREEGIAVSPAEWLTKITRVSL